MVDNLVDELTRRRVDKEICIDSQHSANMQKHIVFFTLLHEW